jgi:hypothetical protein
MNPSLSALAARAPSAHLRHFEAPASVSSVDGEHGIIYGVSLITSGLLARGHQVSCPLDKDKKYDLEVDATTLTQMLSCAQEMKKVPVKWNHKTGADAVSGYLKNFRVEGKKLVGDWHLLKSHERYRHALELAEKMPECLGLSTSFAGKDEIVGERAFARCTRLVSADLVASPAANPDGFFEEGDVPVVDSRAGVMLTQSTESVPATKEFSLGDIMAGITAINERFAVVEERLGQFEEFQDALLSEDHEFEEQASEEEEEEAGEREFASGAEALHYLTEKLAGIEDAKEQAKVDRAFAAYDSKVESLVELNEQLAMENAAMAEAISEFTEKTGATVQFSAAAEGGYTHRMALEDDGRGAPRTAFEERCRELEAAGQDEHAAVRTALKENPDRYNKHLEAVGIRNRSL